MNELNQKIWNFVQTNQFIKENAFFYQADQSSFKHFIWDSNTLALMTQKIRDLYVNVDWLYYSNCSTIFSTIGIHKETNEIFAISGQGEIFYVCYYFQLLPYYLIRESMGTDSVTGFNKYFLFSHHKDKEKALHEYEDWFKKEGIILDKYSFFINDDGSYNPEAFFRDSEGEYDYEGVDFS